MSSMKVVVPLVNSPPVILAGEEWPLAAHAESDKRKYAQEPNKATTEVQRHTLQVRQDVKTGWMVVIAKKEYSLTTRDTMELGEVVKKGEDLVAAIRKMAAKLEQPELADHLIARLPAKPPNEVQE